MMERKGSESDKEQSQIKMTIKTEVEAATSTAFVDIEIDLNQFKQEPVFVQSVKSERSLLEEEVILKDGSQEGKRLEREGITRRLVIPSRCCLRCYACTAFGEGVYGDQYLIIAVAGTPQLDTYDNEQQCPRDTSTPARTDGVNEDYNTSLGEVLNSKLEDMDIELDDMDLGPTVLQHMDIHYSIKKKMSAVPEENTIVGDINKAMPSNEATKESVEDKLRGSITAQKAMIKEWSGGSGALQSLQVTVHKGHLESICRVHLIRLNKFQCELCDALYTEKCSLLQHLQSVHRCLFVKFNKTINQRKPAADNKTTSYKYCDQTRTKPDYDKVRQKDLQQNVLCQHRATSFGNFKCDICEVTFHKPLLRFLHKKLHKLNFMTTGSNTPTTTSSYVAVRSNQSQKETEKQNPSVCDFCEKVCSSKAGLNFQKHSHSGIGVVCQICDVKFSLQNPLADQLRTHIGEKIFQCDICDVRFARSGALTMHMRVHMDEKPYQCDACDARFAQVCALTRHKRVHTGEKPYHCDTCDVRFLRRYALTTHMKSHTAEKPYHCDTCNARFRHSSSLTSHMRIHTKPYQCDMCDARFAQRYHLTAHKRFHTGEKPYQCDTCDAKFPRRDALTAHMIVHTGEKIYQCDTCDARFARNGSLTSHMRIHTGEKPYRCDTCDARFPRKDALTTHMKIHTGEKPYQCDRCDARFARNRSLTSHMRIHTGEKPYRCDTCYARFPRRYALTRHMKVHTGENPYQCDTCDVRFARNESLISHMRIHTGEKPYRCDTCDARFLRRDALTTHVKFHTGEKPYHCDTCDAKFARRYALTRHMKVHTGENPKV